MIWIGGIDNKNSDKEEIVFNLNMTPYVEKKNNTIWFGEKNKIIFKTEEDALNVFNDLKKLLQIS